MSKILGSDVQDSANEHVGKLLDVAVTVDHGSYPYVDALLIKNKGQSFLIHYRDVENLSPGHVTLDVIRSKIERVEHEDKYFFLKRDVLDRQIIDVKGVKVVRVNDIQLGKVDETFSVVGIDVSTQGLLRRLGFDHFDFLKLFQTRYLDWKDVQIVRGRLQLHVPFTNLKKLHPADIANVLEEMNFNAGKRLVGSLDATTAAKVLEEVRPKLRRVLVGIMGPERAAEIVEKMSLDEITDLLKVLPKKEADELLQHFHDSKKLSKIERLLPYHDDTAGGLMTLEYIYVRPDMTVGEALQYIKEVSEKFRSIHFIYVTDEEKHLLGEVSLRTLLVTPHKTPISEIMKRRATLRLEAMQEEIAKRMTKYNLLAMAVVDNDRTILGVVTIDDIMRRLVPTA